MNTINDINLLFLQIIEKLMIIIIKEEIPLIILIIKKDIVIHYLPTVFRRQLMIVNI